MSQLAFQVSTWSAELSEGCKNGDHCRAILISATGNEYHQPLNGRLICGRGKSLGRWHERSYYCVEKRCAWNTRVLHLSELRVERIHQSLTPDLDRFVTLARNFEERGGIDDFDVAPAVTNRI
jgi:hypothetical protein